MELIVSGLVLAAIIGAFWYGLGKAINSPQSTPRKGNTRSSGSGGDSGYCPSTYDSGGDGGSD